MSLGVEFCDWEKVCRVRDIYVSGSLIDGGCCAEKSWGSVRVSGEW